MAVNTYLPQFADLFPRDGSVETAKDFVYYPGEFHIVAAEPFTRRVLRIDQVDNKTTLSTPPNLHAENWITVTVFNGNTRQLTDVKFNHVPIKKVVGGNIVEFAVPLNGDPVPGGRVRKIKAFSQAYIDMRVREYVEKKKLIPLNGKWVEL